MHEELQTILRKLVDIHDQNEWIIMLNVQILKGLLIMSETQQTLATEEAAIQSAIGSLTAAVTSSTNEITSLAGSITALTQNSNGGTLSAADTATLSGFATAIQTAASNLNTSVASASPAPSSTAGSATAETQSIVSAGSTVAGGAAS